MKNLRLIITLLAVCISASVWAVPANNERFTATQSDGSQLSLRLVGDEFYHFYLTDDNVMVLQATDNNFYFAEIGSDGRPTPSKVLAADPVRRTPLQAEFVSGIDNGKLREARVKIHRDSPIKQAQIKQAQALKNRAKTPATHTPEGVGLFSYSTFPITGSPRMLVILVEFSDVKFTQSASYYNNIINTHGYTASSGVGSAKDYFSDSSNGIFTPTFDVYGPVTLDKTRAYYGANDANGNDIRAYQMVIDACNKLDATVDFSQYDTDGDNWIDNVYIFYAGRGENYQGVTSDAVWPHAFYVYSGAGQIKRYDGVYLDHYACSNELRTSTTAEGIGTFVHELSHVLGLPDLYDINYGEAYQLDLTPGSYSVMDHGSYNNYGRTPPTYSAFERNAMGWLDLKTLSSDVGENVTLQTTLKSNSACIIPTSSYKEFFLLENRQKTSWDTHLPGHGMLIWHIDYDQDIWDANSPNCDASRQRVDLIEACGYVSSTDLAAYPFPGTSRVTSITDNTTPNLRTYLGAALNVPITNITESAGLISFTVSGGPNTVVNPPTYNFSGTTLSAVNPFSLVLTPDNPGDQINYTILYYDDTDDSGIYSSPITIANDAVAEIWSVRNSLASERIMLEFEFHTAAPTLTTGGTFATLPKVAMQCETSGATIYYTTDGSTPTTASAVYPGSPVTISAAPGESVTVKAMAMRSGWPASEVVSQTYTLPAQSSDPDPQGAEYTEYQLVTSVADINDTDEYIIVFGTDIADAVSNSKLTFASTPAAIDGTTARVPSSADVRTFSFPVGTTSGSYYVEGTDGRCVGYASTSGTNVNTANNKPVTIEIDATSGNAKIRIPGFSRYLSKDSNQGVAKWYSISDFSSTSYSLPKIYVKLSSQSGGEDPVDPDPDPDPQGAVYELVTDLSSLAQGDQIILVGRGTFTWSKESHTVCQAMSTEQTEGETAYRDVVDITVTTDNRIENPTDNVAIITLGGNATDGWTFAINGGYLNCNSDTKNSLSTVETITDDRQVATISAVPGSTQASIIFNTSETDRTSLVYNPNTGSGRFTCFKESSINASYARPEIFRRVGGIVRPVFSVSPSHIVHSADKSATIHCNVSHSKAQHVIRYEFWAVETDGPAPTDARMRAAAETVVGQATASGNDIAGDTFNVQIPLTGLTADSGVHHVVVRAQAVLTDGSRVDTVESADDDIIGSTGESDIAVDTSKSDTMTGVYDVAADADTPVYYNLQGMPVTHPGPGIYIRRTSHTATKVIIR